MMFGLTKIPKAVTKELLGKVVFPMLGKIIYQTLTCSRAVWVYVLIFFMFISKKSVEHLKLGPEWFILYLLIILTNFTLQLEYLGDYIERIIIPNLMNFYQKRLDKIIKKYKTK